MGLYLALALTCGVLIGIRYRRVFMEIAYWGIMGLGIAFAYRVATIVDNRLIDGYHLWYPIVGGVVGFIVIGVLCADRIRHLLIYFYLQRSIQRDKDAAKAGRLW